MAPKNLKELAQMLTQPGADFDQLVEEFVSNRLPVSETLQIAFGITSCEMETMYREGFEAYQAKEFPKARGHFRMLALLNPFEERFWMSLGTCEMMQGTFEVALKRLAVAALLNDENPYSHLHAYHCYRAMNDPEEAKLALQAASERACHPHWAGAKHEIDQLLGAP